jgi:hypothetical protein
MKRLLVALLLAGCGDSPAPALVVSEVAGAGGETADAGQPSVGGNAGATEAGGAGGAAAFSCENMPATALMADCGGVCLSDTDSAHGCLAVATCGAEAPPLFSNLGIVLPAETGERDGAECERPCSLVRSAAFSLQAMCWRFTTSTPGLRGFWVRAEDDTCEEPLGLSGCEVFDGANDRTVEILSMPQAPAGWVHLEAGSMVSGECELTCDSASY